MKVLIDNDIANALRPLTADEYAGLRAKLMEEGCTEDLPYFRIGDMCVQLDGHNRRKICIQEKIPFKFREHKGIHSKKEALQWVKEHAVSRRNLTPEDITKLKVERLERVAAARAAGHSQREIADQESVSLATVSRDLEKLKKTTVPPGTLAHPPTKILGRDGRAYAVRRKPRARRPGEELFDWKKFDLAYGVVARGVDLMPEAYGITGPNCEGMVRLMRELRKLWEITRKQALHIKPAKEKA